MLDILNFVRGGVSSADNVVPVLTHFCMYGDRLQGSNGRIYIDARCPELGTLNVAVHAERFLRAVDACKGEPKITISEAGKMTLSRKPFRASLPIMNLDMYPVAKPSPGKPKPIKPGFIKTLRTLQPFLSTDAERAWASSVYFDHAEGRAYAASNSMITSALCKALPDTLQIPVFCITELTRLAVEPDYLASDENSITFFWGAKGDQWLKTQKLVAEWPIKTAREWVNTKGKMFDIPKGMMHSVDDLVPFCADPKFPAIYFKDGKIATAPGETQAEIAGMEDIGAGVFHADNLKRMLAASSKMTIGKRAAIFTGDDGFRGVMSLLQVGNS